MPRLRGIPQTLWESSEQRSHTPLSAWPYTILLLQATPRVHTPFSPERQAGRSELEEARASMSGGWNGWEKFVAKNCAVFCEEPGSPGEMLSDICLSTFQHRGKSRHLLSSPDGRGPGAAEPQPTTEGRLCLERNSSYRDKGPAPAPAGRTRPAQGCRVQRRPRSSSVHPGAQTRVEGPAPSPAGGQGTNGQEGQSRC